MSPAGKLLVALSFLAASSSAASAQDIVTIGGETNGKITSRPDVYVVQNGDTLWDISTRFLGDAKFWPLLWSINEYITNPHWIYPGNRIVFVPGTDIEPPSLALEGGDSGRDGYSTSNPNYEEDGAECGLDVRYQDSYPTSHFQAPGFLEDSERLTVLGKVYKARTAQQFLGERDLVYLQLKDARSMDCGDIVSLYRRVEKKVRHPGSRRTKYGAMWKVIGDARILHVKDNIAMAAIRASYFEAQRGDVVGPRMPCDVEFPVESSQGNLDAMVVGRLAAQEAILEGTGAVVFIDRGKNDGVRVGNTFYMLEKIDEFSDKEGTWDKKLPPSVSGRIVVVRVDDRSSTGVVVDAARHVNVGQHLTMSME